MKVIIKDLYEDFTYSLRWSWIGKTYYFFKRLPKNFKNLIDFFPIIWKDRDFDHGYLEDLLKFKLERMYKFFSDDKKTNVVDAPIYAKEIKFVLDCLYTDDSWELTKLHKKHKEKYGEFKFGCIPLEDKPEYSEITSNYSKLSDPKDIERADAEIYEIHKLEEKIRQENFDTAMDIIKERLKYWWD